VKKQAKNSVIILDLYGTKNYKFIDSKFELLDKIKFSKKDIVTSYLANSEIIIEPIEVSASLPKEHIQNVIVDKVYEDLRLDPAIEYQITPVNIGVKNNKAKYQVFITDKNSIKNKIASRFKSLKVLDYLIPAPLLYKVLYQEGKLGSNGSDVFIYFGDEDSFITFYKNGNYIYSKSIKFSVNHMYDRFCQLAQEVPVTKEEFRKLLENDALKDPDNKYRELLVRVINECFLTINDVLIYTKRTYEIENFKIAYVGFSWGYVTGIESYVKNYLNLNSKPMVSIYSKIDPKKAIDPIIALTLKTTLDLKRNVLDVPNLTPFPKPLPFLKRPAGKMIIGAAVASLLFLTPVIYDYIIGSTLKLSNIVLEEEEAKLSAEAQKYRNILKRKREELKAITQTVNKTAQLYNEKKGQLQRVYNKKFNYKLRSEQLTLITKVLSKYDIKSKSIEVSDTLYKIEVESKDDKEITKFIKDLVKHFNKDITIVDIKDIVFDKESSLYKGILKVEFIKDM